MREVNVDSEALMVIASPSSLGALTATISCGLSASGLGVVKVNTLASGATWKSTQMVNARKKEATTNHILALNAEI